MKRAFVRALWGDYKENLEKEDLEFNIDLEQGQVKRRDRTDGFINAFLKDKKKVNHCIDPLHIYIIGKNNLEYLKSKGFENLHLICDKPFKYDPIRRTWWQKLEVLKYAMEDFDEIVYLDWDTYLAREIPDNFWDSLGKKDIFQACLRKYACKKLCHREGNGANKLVSQGGFIYMRDKSIPEQLFKYAAMPGNKWLDETAYARYTDSLTNGWQGTKKYFELFEPEWMVVSAGIFNNVKPNSCFVHK